MKRGSELERGEDTGDILRKRKSNVRSEEVKVQSDELEIRSNEGISWLFCTTCMKELNPKSPADLGVHITGDRHRKNQEQQGKTGEQIEDIKQVLCSQPPEESATAALPLEEKAWRVHVTSVLLRCGIPLNAMEDPELRALIEKLERPIASRRRCSCPTTAASRMSSPSRSW